MRWKRRTLGCPTRGGPRTTHRVKRRQPREHEEVDGVDCVELAVRRVSAQQDCRADQEHPGISAQEVGARGIDSGSLFGAGWPKKRESRSLVRGGSCHARWLKTRNDIHLASHSQARRGRHDSRLDDASSQDRVVHLANGVHDEGLPADQPAVQPTYVSRRKKEAGA